MNKLIAVLVFSTASIFISNFLLADYSYACGCKDVCAKGQKTQVKKAFDTPPKAGTKAICPVMGNEFVVNDKTERSEYKGKHYVFCCSGCKSLFDKEPEKYKSKN